MAEGPKKISFGFSKLSKPSLLSKQKKTIPESDIQYIDCLESKSIKVKDSTVKEEPQELIIPVRGDRSAADVIRSKLEKFSKSDSKHKGESHSVVPESLDAIAAREIIEDLEKKKKDVEKNGALTLPLVETHVKKVSVEVSTLEDYESVPVTDFGMALLRGMGWTPGKGLGKSGKVVQTTTTPVLRPKGMGLGADKLAAMPAGKEDSDENELKVVKGAFVNIVAGCHKDSYGQIEGFDEDGRVIIKSLLGKSTISVLESLVKPVTESEFKRHGRVLNLSKYEEEKRKGNVNNDSDHKRRRTDRD